MKWRTTFLIALAMRIHENTFSPYRFGTIWDAIRPNALPCCCSHGGSEGVGNTRSHKEKKTMGRIKCATICVTKRKKATQEEAKKKAAEAATAAAIAVTVLRTRREQKTRARAPLSFDSAWVFRLVANANGCNQFEIRCYDNSSHFHCAMSSYCWAWAMPPSSSRTRFRGCCSPIQSTISCSFLFKSRKFS